MSLSPTAESVELGLEPLRKMYRLMLLIRAFESRAIELYKERLIRGTTHPYIGQEAVAVGACAALQQDDYITSTHRGHGHSIAKGGDVGPMMAELMGKATGYCKGKGGSMHIADLDLGILGANGIAGGGIGIAVGAGLSSQIRGLDRVVLSFFGDGSANQGIFHEGVNLAAIWKLPVVFICENNMYAISVPAAYATAVKDIGIRGQAYGIPGIVVDGNDLMEVYGAVHQAVVRARAGQGPSLIECKTYRWEGHNIGDPGGYRTDEEIESWKKKDPILRFRELLKGRGVLSDEEAVEMEKSVAAQIEQAVRFGLESPEPSLESALEDVFCETGGW